MLNQVITQYEEQLLILEDSAKASAEQILQLFLVRDRLQKLLSNTTDISADILLTLFYLDSRLKKQANKINQAAELARWRTSLEIAATSWWWFLEPANHSLDKFDWLWNALTVTFLTTSLSLVVDISTRFLSGGVGFFSSFAVISQSVLTLLTAGGVLTGAGRTAIEKLLLKVGIKTHLWEETKLAISLLLLFGLIGFKASLPKIAEAYNQQGLKNYKINNWDEAISNYEMAINIDANNSLSHKQLGLIYEQLQDLEKAKSEYKLAAQGNLPMAYSSLARLYLLEQKPNEAVSLLYLVWNFQPKKGQKATEEDNVLSYNHHKNLGWARFQQKRYPEAKEELEKAITFHETILKDYKDGAAYCLLAQVLEKLKDLKKSQEQWDSCISEGNPRLPEVDGWKFIANQQLEKGEK